MLSQTQIHNLIVSKYSKIGKSIQEIGWSEFEEGQKLVDITNN